MSKQINTKAFTVKQCWACELHHTVCQVHCVWTKITTRPTGGFPVKVGRQTSPTKQVPEPQVIFNTTVYLPTIESGLFLMNKYKAEGWLSDITRLNDDCTVPGMRVREGQEVKP